MIVASLVHPHLSAFLVTAGMVVFGTADSVQAEPQETIRVATYNIEWCRLHGPTGDQVGVDCSKVADVIRDMDVDFIGLQEVRTPAMTKQIADALGYNWYFGYALDGSTGSTLGNAILTRHPILESETHLLPFEEWQQRAAVEILSEVDGIPLRVISAHTTFNNRSDKDDQLMALMNIISSSDEPRILLGDFNDMDNRPNAYSPEGGFINLITGAGHGTILPSAAKMFDFHRKCAEWSQVRNDPPYYSLKTDWDPPHRDANSISHWEPRVRIDHIFVSPDFYLDHPSNTATTIDTGEIMGRLHPSQGLFYVSDHRPVMGQMLIPRPPVELFLNPQEGRTILTVGESRTIYVGGIDENGNAVSLLRTDSNAPLNDPARTARMVSGVTWTYTGSGITLQDVDPLIAYDPYIRAHKPSSGAVRVSASSVGQGTLRAKVGNLERTLNIRVIPEGERYTYTAN